MYSGSWGSNSVNDVSAFMPYFLGGELNDYARDRRRARPVEKGRGQRRSGGASTRPIARRSAWPPNALISSPLFSAVRYVAFSKQLNFQGFPDDLPRFYLSSWK